MDEHKTQEDQIQGNFHPEDKLVHIFSAQNYDESNGLLYKHMKLFHQIQLLSLPRTAQPDLVKLAVWEVEHIQ